jgi:CubicO group peptidase (beta-lactamase class C family)
MRTVFSSGKAMIARKIIALFLALSLAFSVGCQSHPVEPTVPDEAANSTQASSSDVGKASSKTEASSKATAAPAVYHNTVAGNEDLLDDLLDITCEIYHVTGMSVAAFERDCIVYRHSYGLANREANLAADSSTKYRIASISKMVTAMLALMLTETSDFDIDEDLRLRIPALYNPYFPDAPITTRQLMLHTSGFQDGAGYLNAISYGRFPPLSTVLNGGGVWTGVLPGREYVYTNFGGGLMAGAIESVTGGRFYDYAKEALFDPLGIDAGYSVSLIEDKAAIASIYENGNRTAAPSQWGNMSAAYAGIPLGEMYLLGQGELVISAEDLAKIGMILAGDGSYEGKTYLSPETLAPMNSIQFTDAEQNITRGLGTMAVSELIPGTQLYGHQGNAYGMIAGLFYDPVYHTGVVFLSNGCYGSKDEQGIYSVNRAIMRDIWEYL